MKTHYFISGLPRSGSTLICNILHQNPKFFVSPSSSGCHDVLFGIRNQWDKLIEHQSDNNPDQLRRVMLSVLNSYHGTEKDIVFDKGRGWLPFIEMLEFIKSGPVKIIVPVRDIAEIVASFEKLWRKSSGITEWGIERANYFKAQTVEGRCDMWTSFDNPIGLAYNRVKDAILRGHSKSLHFVEFDDLTNDPSFTLRKIYDFLGEEYFQHDFDNIEQYTKEDDLNVHKVPSIHTIRPYVNPVPKCAIEVLGPVLAQKYSNLEIWRSCNYINCVQCGG